MNDLISRQAALEKVRTMQTYKLFMGDDMILIDKADVQTELMMLPTAQPEPQWIPCSERMPEPRIDVWVNSDLGQMVGYYDETTELWYGRNYLELIVNAWMPLPEAYKEGGERI